MTDETDDFGAADEAAWDAEQAARPYRRADGLEWAAALVGAAHAAGYYAVPGWRLEDVRAKLATLARRAARVGTAAPELREVGMLVRDCGKTVREYAVVQVTGPVVKAAGWRLVARLDYLHGEGESGVIVATVPGATLRGDYSAHDGSCDHCRTRRQRTSTYVVAHEDEREAVVGSGCLAEFFGLDPRAVVASAELLRELGDACEGAESDEGGYGSGSRERIKTRAYLTQVAQVVRTCGWMPRSRATPYDPATADIALARLCALFMGKGTEETPTDADAARAEEALTWARELTDEEVGRSDYLHNLRVLARVNALGDRHYGLAASIIAAHDKAREREIERRRTAAGVNEWFGVVGQAHVRKLTLLRVVECSSQFGVSFLHVLEDEQGRRAKWFASRSSELVVVARTWVSGTVKAHDTYEGRRQTALTRCAVVKDPATVCPALAGVTAAQAKRLHGRAMGLAAGAMSAVDKKLYAAGLVDAGGAVTDAGRKLLRDAGVPA